jgi:hypothetical protein
MTSELVLHTDVMFVNSVAFLISVTTPLGLTTLNALGHSRGARAVKSIEAALISQLDV